MGSEDILTIFLVILGLINLVQLVDVTTSKSDETTGIESLKSTPAPSWHVHVHEEGSNNVTFNVTLDTITLKESFFFTKKLFAKYGDQQNLNQSDLTLLLHHLGLGQAHDHGLHKRSAGTVHIHTDHEKCLSAHEILEAFHLASQTKLTAEEFTYLCPAIVFQLDLDLCKPHHAHEDKTEDTIHGPVENVNLSKIPSKVWGFSFIAVLIISLVGLLGVAVIPIMQKVFYNHLLQFLVALAIGALSGDALLHLLPHAIIGSSTHKHDHDAEMAEEHDHSAAAWKGLMALGGILFFFVTERLLTIITVIKRNRNSKRQNKKKRCQKFCDIESNKTSVGAKLSHRQTSEDGCDRTVMLVHPNKDEASGGSANALKSYADAAHEEFLHQCDDEITLKTKTKQLSEKEAEMELMEVSRATDQNGVGFVHSGGHSHGHGHAHGVPTSVAAVAWMVILGDGIHNFSDGLAIGAAFANSITGGFSTSVAVFCHELPHEIGDFAVLLRAGMTVKQAVLYNCLSSLLCLVGMLIGVAIGNISSASLWIFATVGGMFLYIALVDMLPEMSSVDPKKGENPFLHLFLQVLGILLGSGIMLLIALYEHDIKKSFG
ncbi:unnamed protein product [Lymnaea stagnalis]|uniref:Zinc transporter ZIP4/12 EF-hand domain-containing protein n=1 Tax=Lymnaea stagnalis TaxID=6523 RepID=A0AAV2HRM1_LYMST